MPEEPPGSEASAAGMYSLTDDDGLGGGSAGQCPSCGAEMAADAVICIECGYNVSTGQQMGEAPAQAPPPRRRRDQDDEARAETERRIERAEANRNLWVPLGFVIVGIALELTPFFVTIGQAAADGESEVALFAGMALGMKVVLTLVGLVIGVAVSLLACFTAAKIMDIDFGPLGTGILKLAAVYMAPGAVAVMLNDLVFGLGWIVSGGVYYGLLSWLFDLDFLETVVVAVVLSFIKTWLIVLVIGFLAILLTSIR